MSIVKSRQRPMRLASAGKQDVRTQFGALPWRRGKDGVQVLLITSRRTRRWILPKGWPIEGRTPSETAAQEAWEEAGAKGEISDICIGIYPYIKEFGEDDLLPCVVALFPLRVQGLEDEYPEVQERKRRWFRPKKAAGLVDEPELATILRTFDPTALPRQRD